MSHKAHMTGRSIGVMLLSLTAACASVAPKGVEVAVTFEPEITLANLPITPLECGIVREVPVETFMEANTRDGLQVFWFDTNGDGSNDVNMLRPFDSNPWPWLYVFDNNYDDEADVAYYDAFRNGKCVQDDGKNSIYLYWYGPQKDQL